METLLPRCMVVFKSSRTISVILSNIFITICPFLIVVPSNFGCYWAFVLEMDFFCSASGTSTFTNSIMSPISQFKASHIFNKTSVLTFPPCPSFATEVALMPLISRRVFLLIPLSISYCCYLTSFKNPYRLPGASTFSKVSTTAP